MCQSLDFCDTINEIRYKILCELYSNYKLAIKTALDKSNKSSTINSKIEELDSILQEVEKYPISWSYYTKQKTRFSSDFENLVIFKNDI